MGANDICDLCKNPLDMFNYYIFNVKHKTGLITRHEMTERYCSECVGVLGLDNHPKWVGKV